MPYEIFRGNPHDNARPAVEQETYARLDTLGIPYDRVDHEAAFTIEACAEIDAAFGTPMCKNLFLRNSNGSAFYLLLMPGDKPFKTKELSHQIGSTRLSFADEEHMQSMLGVMPGSVTVLGLAYDTDRQVQLLIDEDVLRAPYICCHPCVNTSSLRIETTDILEKFLPAVGHTPQIVRLTGVV